MDVVISCQRCLRLYDVSPSLHGQLGRCYACKSCFAINVAELALPGEAILFDQPLTPRYNFMREGTAELARNIGEMHRLAGIALTPAAASLFAKTLPRSSEDMESKYWSREYCSLTMEMACRRTQGTSEADRWRELFDYFAVYIPTRTNDALDMLVGAFLGVLSVEFDTAEPDLFAPMPKLQRRVSGWLRKAVGL